MDMTGMVFGRTVIWQPISVKYSVHVSRQATAYDKDFPPLRATRQHSITSRVSVDESRRSTPPIPPGFEAQVANENRRSTPTVPPGLGKPTALLDLEGGVSSRPSSRPSSRANLRRTASQILPALPLRPGTPAKRGNQDESRSQAHETPTKPSKTPPASELKSGMTADEVSRDGRTNEEEEHESSGQAQTKDLTKRSPGIGAKTVESRRVSPDPLTPGASAGPSAKKKSLTSNENQKTPMLTKESGTTAAGNQKRKHPGNLDISAATHEQDTIGNAQATQADVETPSKASRPTGQNQPPSTKQSDSPAASPIVKTAPRTLRVVQTPKTEGPPSTVFAASPLPPGITNRIPSRQPSLASINPPGTPLSEQVYMSDNVSMASTSQSRANSPPPAASKVGSAPLRTKTKNQLKKERQERAKAMEEEKAKVEEAVKPSVEEPAQEAIVSRKKKAKKEKEPKAKAKTVHSPAAATPANSQPSTPSAKSATQEAPKVEVAPVEAKVPKPATPTKAPSKAQSSTQSPSGPSPPPTPTPTAAQLIADLKASAPEIQKCIDSLFRVSNSNYYKPTQSISQKDLVNPATWRSDFKVNLSKDEVEALLNGTVPAIHYGGEDGRVWDRGMVTPSGAHLRALTKELETRFLELEKALREMPEEFRFRPSKPQNEMKFPSIDLEALKRQFDSASSRGVSAMEQIVQDGSSMKKGAFLVDEASKYINEFIMPPVTSPPAASSNSRGQTATGLQTSAPESVAHSPEVLERRLIEAKRVAEERENALKKICKKNKRILGLS